MIVLVGFKLKKEDIEGSPKLDKISKNKIEYNKYMLEGLPVFQVKDQFFVSNNFIEVPFNEIMEHKTSSLTLIAIKSLKERLTDVLDKYDIKYHEDRDFGIWILN